MANWLRKIFPSANEREVAKLMKRVDRILALEPRYHAMKEEELRDQTRILKERLAAGETLDDILEDAYAVVREATVRIQDKHLFPVQLLGGIVLHQGRIAEMKTGEGKTNTSTLPAYLNALSGQGVHVVTVNDYLATFHSEWMGKIYQYLGLTVGLVVPGMSPAQKREAYLCDITYGTNNEFGFDYLRDNMAVRKADLVQRHLHYAIVDEVDSILIDEARTPLIISGRGEKSTDGYERADQFVSRLKEGEDADYTKDEKLHTVMLTALGVAKAENFFNLENLSDIENSDTNHYIQQALKAHALMQRDRDYIVQNDEVIIVDEFTGRIMVGRRFSDGLHQAIEAKEHVKVQNENKTLATITLQNYFRIYDKLCGMTGTAKTEEEEFRSIYGMDVVEIPTNRPMIRNDYNDVVYRTEEGKFRAVVREIVECHEKGQPVLVGTVSVEKSEYLSRLLKRTGTPHVVLNAKYHAQEADIVAQAGKLGAVTIATNMAGRGTDILLGGNPEFIARQEMKRRGLEDDVIESAISIASTEEPVVLAARELFHTLYAEAKVRTDEEHAKVVALGGLHIIGTERHESRRIDNQLRGRAGRQGDPGSSRFYISLEDDLMRLFGSDRIEPLIGRMGMDEDTPLEFSVLSGQIESAQKRVESRNFDTRKRVLQYDDVMNQQRSLIYAQRKSVLEGADVHDSILGMADSVLDTWVNAVTSFSKFPEDWDLGPILEQHGRLCRIDPLKIDDKEKLSLTPETLKKKLSDVLLETYAEKEKEITDAGYDMREVERTILLRVVDEKWMEHIDNMDQLRRGIGLRAIGNKNPVVEYRMEGSEMFDVMITDIQEGTIGMLFSVRVNRVPERREVAKATGAAQAGEASRQTHTPIRVHGKIGRNDPCPCGSGKKYKNCHGRLNGAN